MINQIQRSSPESLFGKLEKAAHLDQLHFTFMQNVSHELRTPIAIILGYAELLHTGNLGKLTSEQAEVASAMAKYARKLQRIVERIETMLSTTRRQPLPFSHIVMDVVKERSPAMLQGRLTLLLDIEPGLPFVFGDGEQLKQAVDSLVENAIKFTPHNGQVSVKLYYEDNWICMSIEDTGIGISAQELDNVFKNFYQVDDSNTRRYGGLGLGLAVAKAVVESHEGHIDVASQLGMGSQFTIKLPEVSWSNTKTVTS